MDLKGSLIDTNLRIYPAEKLINFIQTLPSKDAPENFLKFLNGKDSLAIKSKLNGITKEKTHIVQLTDKDVAHLKKIKKEFNVSKHAESNVKDSDVVTESSKDIECDDKSKDSQPQEEGKDKNKDASTDKSVDKEREGPYLSTSDMDWLYTYLQNKRKLKKDVPYLHELLDGSDIETPGNEVIKRNPVLEARCVKLRSQQEAREYRKMTRGVDNVRIRFPDDSISYQLKQLNRQLIAIGQFIISIFAGFLFGFKGIEWLVGTLDFGFKLLLGVMCALVIALAEIYFLAKKLNEELSIPETTQLGGPPKFVDTKRYGNEPSAKVSNKEHQD